MPSIVPRAGRDLILRHGETVFNAARRMQGDTQHVPLTGTGFAQARAMGAALHRLLGTRPALTLWSSPSGRALQTMALIVEPLGLEWGAVRIDPRLAEIDVGRWGGRLYAEIEAEHGPVTDPATGLLHAAPDGETHADVATRLRGWLADTDGDAGDRLVVMHGISSRMLRGLMRGGGPAGGLPQGSITAIAGGVETIVHRGTGYAPA